VWKISPPPGFDPRAVHPLGNHCTAYGIRPSRYVFYHFILGSVAEDGLKHVTFVYYDNILSTILTVGVRDVRNI
jgi:hypothetical protein